MWKSSAVSQRVDKTLLKGSFLTILSDSDVFVQSSFLYQDFSLFKGK